VAAEGPTEAALRQANAGSTPLSAASRRRSQSLAAEADRAETPSRRASRGRPASGVASGVLWQAETPAALAGAQQWHLSSGSPPADLQAAAEAAASAAARGWAGLEDGRCSTPGSSKASPPPRSSPNSAFAVDCSPPMALTPSTAPSSRQSLRGARLLFTHEEPEAERKPASEAPGANACELVMAGVGCPEVVVAPAIDSSPFARRASASSCEKSRAVRRSRVSSQAGRTQTTEGTGASSSSAPAGAAAAAIRRSKSMPVAEEPAKNVTLASALRKGRAIHGRRNSINGSALPKSSAAGGAGVAPKLRKRALPSSKKMVLPFVFPLDDPRNYHIETTGGLTCPAFLPQL